MEEQKQYIISTAISLFLRYNFKIVSMDFIAQEGRISKKTIYKHFRNKEHLIEEALMEIGHRIQKQFTKVSSEKHNSVEALYNIFYVTFIYPSSEISSFYYSLKQYSINKYGLFYSILINMLYVNTKSQIEKGIANGVFIPQIEAQDFCLLLTSLMQGIRLKIESFPQFNHKDATALIANAIYYSLRSVVTVKGLELLEMMEIDTTYHWSLLNSELIEPQTIM